MSSARPFIYVWAYRVSPDQAEEFRGLYGPGGSWVRLFSRAAGYLGTDLYRDRNDGDRYVTVDRWESKEAFTSFRASFADEFQRLDREGERVTLEEIHLGDFELG